MKISRAEYLNALEIVKQYLDAAKSDIKDADRLLKQYKDAFIGVNKDTPLNDAGLSVRAHNCLKAAVNKIDFETKVGELEGMFTIKQLASYRNFGKRSLMEVMTLFQVLNMNFKKD
jgi:DNA-directed RNA polymerase alpha subunit